jgi:hypothetical protein
MALRFASAAFFVLQCSRQIKADVVTIPLIHTPGEITDNKPPIMMDPNRFVGDASSCTTAKQPLGGKFEIDFLKNISSSEANQIQFTFAIPEKGQIEPGNPSDIRIIFIAASEKTDCTKGAEVIIDPDDITLTSSNVVVNASVELQQISSIRFSDCNIDATLVFKLEHPLRLKGTLVFSGSYTQDDDDVPEGKQEYMFDGCNSHIHFYESKVTPQYGTCNKTETRHLEDANMECCPFCEDSSAAGLAGIATVSGGFLLAGVLMYL